MFFNDCVISHSVKHMKLKSDHHVIVLNRQTEQINTFGADY